MVLGKEVVPVNDREELHLLSQLIQWEIWCLFTQEDWVVTVSQFLYSKGGQQSAS